MYETMSISTGLYPNPDLWNANKLHYITLMKHSHNNTEVQYIYIYIYSRTDVQQEVSYMDLFLLLHCKTLFYLLY